MTDIVVYEDHPDAEMYKSLSTAITNAGNSIAGGIIQRQKYAAQYARDVASRAHDAYLQQQRIASTERVAKDRLDAQKAQNTITNAQNAERVKIAQKQEARNDEMWKAKKTDMTNISDAIEASQVILEPTERFTIANGIVQTVDVDSKARKDALSVIKKAPTVWTTLQDDIASLDQRKKVVRGRLQVLNHLMKDKTKRELILGKLTNGRATSLIDLEGVDGSPGNQLLNALGDAVKNDEYFEKLLEDDFGIDGSSINSGDLKDYHLTRIGDYGSMLKNYDLSPKTHGLNFSKNNNVQQKLSVLTGYQKNTEWFDDKNESVNSNEAILSEIRGHNLDESLKDKVVTTARVLNSHALDFLHQGRFYLKNPSKITRRFRERLGRIAQGGGEVASYTGVDKDIQDLLFDDMTPPQRNALEGKIVNSIMQKTYQKDKKGFLGVLSNKDAQQTVNRFFTGTNAVAGIDSPKTKQQTGNVIVSKVNAEQTEAEPLTMEQFLLDEEANGNYHQKLKGYLFDNKWAGITNGVITGRKNIDEEMNISIAKTSPIQLANWIFDDSEENRSQGPGKMFGDTLNYKKRLATEFTQKEMVEAVENRGNQFHKLGEWLGFVEKDPEGPDKTKGYSEFKNLNRLYAFGRSVIKAQMIAMQQQGKVEGFVIPGPNNTVQLGKWADAIDVVDPTTGVKPIVNKKWIDKVFPEDSPSPIRVSIRNNLLTLMKLLGNKDDDGTAFGFNVQLRMLKEQYRKNPTNLISPYVGVINDPNNQTDTIAGN